MKSNTHDPEAVLALWFPESGHQNSMETHAAFWTERMQGGMDATIIARFADLTEAAATGQLDHWADTPRGRLALLLALDQFSRSLWRDTPAAFGQDIKAARLALEGLENGHFDPFEPWEQTFYVIAITHCEGPDHMDRLQRLDPVVEGIAGRMPEHLCGFRDRFREQQARVKAVVGRFGRHPHRNPVLGRLSTTDEAAYIATGDFPHLPRPT